MEGPLILLRFFGYYWRPFMSEVLYLCQTFTDCVFNQYWYVKMTDVTTIYGKSLLILLGVLRILHTSALYSPNIHKLCFDVTINISSASYGTLPDFITFFLGIIDNHSCLKYCIFAKFSQIVCLINIYIFKL